MRKNLKFYVILFALICICFGLFFLLANIQRLLVHEKPLEHADAIVVLGGGTGSRVKKAVDLYVQGVSDVLIMTGGPKFSSSEAQFMKDFAIDLGVRSEDVVIETQSLSTMDHVFYLEDIFKEKNIQSIVIVTSLFHTSRAYNVFFEFYKSKLEIGVLGAEDGVDYSRWWTRSEDIEKIIIELQKYIWYKFFY